MAKRLKVQYRFISSCIDGSGSFYTNRKFATLKTALNQFKLLKYKDFLGICKKEPFTRPDGTQYYIHLAVWYNELSDIKDLDDEQRIDSLFR